MANETGQGKAGAAASVVQANAHPETIDTTDAGLSGHGAFDGADLRPHGRGHFAGEHPAPDDDRLTTDVAAWRAGAGERNEYAQAQPLGGSYDSTSHMEHNAIGRVDKVVGNVTVVRNGVAVVLHAGDAVFKSDVIQTGSSSSVGIFFSDGTAVHLVANTRMALTAYSYDAGSDANAAAFSLIDGTFGFVAGKLANHGDMNIMTPVATMSVHEGATGWAHELTAGEIASISAKLGSVSYSFAVTDHGDQTHGLFDLIADGNVVGSISDPHLVSYLDRDGNLLSFPLDSSSVTGELAQWLQAGDVVPSALGVHGSGSPIDAPSFPSPISLNSDLLSFSLATGNGFNSDATGTPIAFFVPGLLTPSSPPGSPSSHIFIWNGVGDWDKNPLDWNQGFAPTSAIDTVIIQTGKASYSSGYTIGSLTVDHGATLNITGGSLAASGISNAGLIELNSSGADPSLVITGAMTLTGGGAIEMLGPTTSNFIVGAAGAGATLTNADNLITGSGNIGNGNGNLTFINEATVDATPVLHGDSGLLVVNTGHTIGNLGVLEATLAGELLIDDRLINAKLVKADGTKSSVVIANDSPDLGGNLPANANVNTALIEAIDGGLVIIENSTIVNSGIDGQGRIVDGLVEAGAASEILLDNATILQGFVSVLAGGEISTAVGTADRIDTANGSTHNTTVASIVNAGKMLVSDDSSLTLASPFDIENAGAIELASTDNETLLDFNQPFAILSGGGSVILDGGTGVVPKEKISAAASKGAEDIIDGEAGPGFATVNLENRDNTISGAGAIGQGDGALAFRNDTRGAVDADLRGQTLLIATGSNVIDNAGLFEASVGGTLDIESSLDNSGHVVARAASAILIKADVANESGGTIAADGIFARIDISGTAGHPITVDNDADVVARHGGRVSFQFSQITNEAANGSEPAGRIIAGRNSRIDVDDSSVDNAGVIAARHGGAIAFDLDQVTNQSTGLIGARGRGSEIGFDRDAIDNSGIIEAEHRGTVELDNSLVANDDHGTIDAEGFGATIRFERDVVGNWGTISATLGGLLVADQSCITNLRGATIEADARDSLVRLDRDDVDNSGRIEAEDRGTVVLGRSDVENDRHGVVEADGRGSEVRFDRDHVDNSGRIEADNRGTVVLDRSVVENDRRGAVEADGRGSEVRFDHDHVDNCGRIEADRQGEVTFDSSHVDNDGMIGALRGGTVDFNHTHVDNTDGLIAAIGRDSTIDLDHADITGGTLATTWGGPIRTAGGNSDLNDVTIACNSDVLVEKGTTLTLDHGTTMNGGRLTVDGTLHVEPSLAILNGVDVVNHGNIVVDPGSATLEVENGAVISGGNLTVGPNGTLDVDGSTLSNVAIFDAGVVNFGAGDTLSPTDVLTFVGVGTVHVQDSAAFDVTLAGLATGDVIDLQDIAVTSAVWDGSSLLLNGAPAAFTISGGMPAGDTFGFTSDGHGGTDLEVVVTGTATVADGGSLEIASPSNQTVTFAGLTGELRLDDPTAFFGHIVGFSATASNSDDIELVGIDFNSPHFAESYDATTHQLTVSDGTHSASLTLDYFDNVLNFTSDGQGGTLVANQPSTVPSGGSLEISKLSDGTVNFVDATGALKIDNPADFSGHIDGFSATATSSDVIDVSGINFNAPDFTESYNAATHQFTMSDGAQSASFYLDYFSNALNFTGDGQGGTLITNQPAGPMMIAAGERLDVWGLDGDTITFAAGTGELKLDNPAGFWGHIAGFTGTQADAAHSDVIDLVGVDANTATFNYNSSSGLLIVTDGTYHASFTFDNFNGTLKFASDGNGGTLIFDPPKPAGITAGAAAVAGGDSFRWISEVNENPSSIHVDPPHAGTVAGQLPHAVQSFMQGQAQAEWWAEAGHHDVLVNATLDQMQAHLQSGVHLH